MAYDLEEQEQLDNIKAWWTRHGNRVIWLVTAALLAFAGFKGWQYYLHKQSLEASAQYELLTQADSRDTQRIRSISTLIMEKYARTPYAARAALLAAKANYTAGDAKSARLQTEWAVSHATEEGLRAIALLQLASLQLEEKQYDAALRTLGEKHASGFDGLFADLRGDVLAAQGKRAEARTAYADALAKLNGDSRYRRYTEFKLDAMGQGS